MGYVNKVFLMGNLTRDPELRYLQAGTAVVRIGMAVNRKYRNKSQEMVEETTFVDIEGWGNQAETVNRYVRKGSPLFIEGRLRLDSWETKDGQKRNKLMVVMDNFQFIGSPGAGRDAPRADRAAPSAGAGKVADRGGQKQAEEYDFDDIPF